MKENYNTIELLFDLPRRLKNIDNKIKILSIYSWDEENCERLFNKIYHTSSGGSRYLAEIFKNWASAHFLIFDGSTWNYHGACECVI